MEKREKLFEILNKAKDYLKDKSSNSFSTTKSFDMEVIDINNEIENSMVFESLNEATNLIFDLIQNNKDGIYNHIKKSLTEKGLNTDNEFRVLFHLS